MKVPVKQGCTSVNGVCPQEGKLLYGQAVWSEEKPGLNVGDGS